jgi:peptide-methionine (R)-S-oxide reductase
MEKTEICFRPMLKKLTILIMPFFFLVACSQKNTSKEIVMSNKTDEFKGSDSINLPKTEEEWKKILPENVYQISRLKGTERPFTGKYNQHIEVGTYKCIACNNPLFRSDGKFESSCGWPSFFEPISKESIVYVEDNTHGMKRTEVICGRCKGHLGHVFNDGPPPTGLRYCINSVILSFDKNTDHVK